MKGESIELPLATAGTISSNIQIIVLAPLIRLRVRQTVFPHRKLVQLDCIKLYYKLRENTPLYILLQCHMIHNAISKEIPMSHIIT